MSEDLQKGQDNNHHEAEQEDEKLPGFPNDEERYQDHPNLKQNLMIHPGGGQRMMRDAEIDQYPLCRMVKRRIRRVELDHILQDDEQNQNQCGDAQP